MTEIWNIVEQLIYQVKKSAGMYASCIELETIVYFINGFMCNNFISSTVDSNMAGRGI